MATINEIVGFIKLKGGEQFSRELKGRLQGVRESFLNVNKAIAGAGVVLFLKNVNDAANSLSQSNRQLAATSKLTGIDLSQLSSIAKTAEHSFKLSTQQANKFTIAVSKLTGKAGDLGKTGDAISRLLDLAAAQGLDAEQALIAINQAILGIDEGTDKLFQKNPSAIYEEYAKQIGTSAGKLNDQQKAQALLNAVMTDGVKVQGEYQKFLSDAPGKQQQFATALQRTSATLGQMTQTVLTPFLELITNVVEWFNNLSDTTKNLAVALGAVTTGVYFFGGALAALLPMIGPAGWVLIALGAVTGLFLALEGRTRAAAKATEEFRGSLAALSIEQAEKKLTDLQERLRSFRLEMRATNTNMGGTSIPINLAEKQQLEEQIKILQQAIAEKKRLAQAAAATPVTGVNKKEMDDAKARLDKQREFEFETNRLSRRDYLAHLKTRLADFGEWSDEWIGLQRKVFDLQKAAGDEAQKAESEKAKNRLQVELDGMSDSREQMLGYLQQRQTDLESAGQKFSDEWMQVYQEIGRVEKTAGEERKRNFENSIKTLDEQAKFEAEINQISRAQYLDYLRSRLDDFAEWSDEWINRKREIAQLEMAIEKQEAEAQKAIWQQQRDQALAIAGDLRNAIATIGSSIAESIRTSGDAFKAFWKSMLLRALDAIERYLLLAKIKSIIEAAINPLTALKNAAPLIIAAGLLQVAKSQIAALAEGTVVKKPTLALIGEAGQPEVVAPERDFMSYSKELVKQALKIAVKPLVDFKNIAKGFKDSGLLQQRQAQIALLLGGVLPPAPAFAGISLPSRSDLQFSAPAEFTNGSRQRGVESASRELSTRRPALNMTLNFNTPLNDRRTAARLTDEVLRPAVKRDFRREDRKLGFKSV